MSDDDERSPLLHKSRRKPESSAGALTVTNADVHSQFCFLVGVPPSNAPANPKAYWPKSSLYSRATRQLSSQTRTYLFTAVLTNSLLLSQVVLGAVVTGLGATESSHLIITVIGAMNTIIAGVVAYLKSRGQPMRARMYKDDLERVVDEIENSEVMWLGIAQNIQGYDEVDDDGEVTVRSEVARLTRLYDRAVRNNTANNPDMYVAGPGVDSIGGGKRSVTVSTPQPISTAAPAPAIPSATVPTPTPPPKDPDASPASAPPKRTDTPKPVENVPAANSGTSSATPAPPPATGDLSAAQPTAPTAPSVSVPVKEPVAAPPATVAAPTTTNENAPGAIAHDDDDETVPATRKDKNEQTSEPKKEEPTSAGSDPPSAAPTTESKPISDPVAAPQPPPEQPQQATIQITPTRDPDESPATAPPRKRPNVTSATSNVGKENARS